MDSQNILGQEVCSPCDSDIDCYLWLERVLVYEYRLQQALYKSSMMKTPFLLQPGGPADGDDEKKERSHRLMVV
jgi:hypothetical protein